MRVLLLFHGVARQDVVTILVRELGVDAQVLLRTDLIYAVDPV
jgi:hypothetical protein